MLVLSRKEGESVCIGDNVVVTIVKVSGNKIRVGIETQEKVSILRGELKNQDECHVPILEFEISPNQESSLILDQNQQTLLASA